MGGDVELVLSYGSIRRKRSGPYQVLDAGCGRGLGLLGAATLQPKVRWLGVDISRTSLEDARAQAAKRGLTNVTFTEADLMTLEGVEIPDGGFDIIHSSGVLHHLQDPRQGLIRLKEVLAPHGMIVLMVYGLHGREPLQRLAGAINLLFPDDVPLNERVPIAREVAAVARDHALAGTDFANSADVNDVELVDRLLNVNETSYDVPSLLNLLTDVGLRFVRWSEPADWDPGQKLPDGPLRRRLTALDPALQWQFMETLFQPSGLELVAAHAANAPRPALQSDEIAEGRFRLHPEVVITTGVRHTPEAVRTENLSFVLRKRQPVPLASGPIASAVMHLSKRAGERKGKALLRDLQKLGQSADEAKAVILELERHEVIFKVP